MSRKTQRVKLATSGGKIVDPVAAQPPPIKWFALETYFFGTNDPAFFVVQEKQLPLQPGNSKLSAHVGVRLPPPFENQIFRDPAEVMVNLDWAIMMRYSPLQVTDVMPKMPDPEHIPAEALAAVQEKLAEGQQ